MELTLADPVASAKAAGLRYVTDAKPGITRRRSRGGFAYFSPSKERISDSATLARIRSLVIPPAWTNVWICPAPSGHLQATGRDARGRKQYRYHPRWREVRDATKYGRMVTFGAALPMIRERTDEHLRLPGLPREKVLATVVRLLETTCIRIGNEEYARTNRSFGLTTLRGRHVEIEGSTIHFHFRGKAGVYHDVGLRDRRLARIIKNCQEIPGHELFQYIAEDGSRQSIDSADVNDYLRRIGGEEFTAKDFRTWAGTLFAAFALRECGACESEAQRKKNIVQAVKSVAERLGNTVAVCRKCYIHPSVLEAYMDGTLIERLESSVEDSGSPLKPDEAALLGFLRASSGRMAA
jgi:DNA topoisomerase-1